MSRKNKPGFYCEKCIKDVNKTAVFSKGGLCPNTGCNEILQKQSDRDLLIGGIFQEVLDFADHLCENGLSPLSE